MDLTDFKSIKRKVVLVFTLIILFILYNDLISHLITKYFLIEENSLPVFFDITVILFSIISTVYLFSRVFIQKYVASFTEKFVSSIIILITFYFLLNPQEREWEFLHDSFFDKPYVFYALLPLIAFLIASPIAGFVMHNWLQDFAYKINIQWWMFLLSGGSAICIALCTVSFYAIKASLSNPVNSLRTE